MKGRLYTIGHSVVPVENIIVLLKQNLIDYVVDVRSIPYSQHASQYNKDIFKGILKVENISYYHKGKSFGARQTELSYYNKDGYLDFEAVRKSAEFNKCAEEIMHSLEKGLNIVLMCTEKDPIDCHRAIMVARGFELLNVPVTHILHDGSLQTQQELGERLIKRFFPDHNQISLFESEKSETELLVEAYRARNKDIGFHKENLFKKGEQQDDNFYNGIY